MPEWGGFIIISTPYRLHHCAQCIACYPLPVTMRFFAFFRDGGRNSLPQRGLALWLAQAELRLVQAELQPVEAELQPVQAELPLAQAERPLVQAEPARARLKRKIRHRVGSSEESAKALPFSLKFASSLQDDRSK